MKTKIWIILIAAILAVSAALCLLLLFGQSPAASAQIKSGDKVVATLDLSVDQELVVTTPDGHSNTVTVRDGKISVTEADCPDHYCMQRGFRNHGTPIVCLPNKLVIIFLQEAEIDGLAG